MESNEENMHVDIGAYKGLTFDNVLTSFWQCFDGFCFNWSISFDNGQNNGGEHERET